ncbi:urease accessory UreF family protein [Nocardioides maradonensis]
MTTGLLMVLGDGRLPTGGHAQSAGLEPAVLAGLDPGRIPDFIDTRLRTAITVDAAAAVVTRALALEGTPLDPVLDAWTARTPGTVARGSALATGRGIQRVLRRLWPDAGATRLLEEVGPPYRPIALGALAAAAGLGAHDTAVLVCHEDVSAIASAALKLVPRDPLDATAWLLAAQPRIAAIARDLADLTDPAAMPALSAPLAECWIQAHAARERRLFSA